MAVDSGASCLPLPGQKLPGTRICWLQQLMLRCCASLEAVSLKLHMQCTCHVHLSCCPSTACTMPVAAAADGMCRPHDGFAAWCLAESCWATHYMHEHMFCACARCSRHAVLPDVSRDDTYHCDSCSDICPAEISCAVMPRHALHALKRAEHSHVPLCFADSSLAAARG